MIGTIQKKEFTKNGAPKFQISGGWYFLNRDCQPQEFAVGTAVEFEWTEFGEDRGRGRPKAISKWRVSSQPVVGSASTGSSGAPQTITDVDILRSVSNIVGSACAAGTIKSAEELEKWCLAARIGLSSAMSRTMQRDKPEPDRLPGSDDDMDDWDKF
jgi:hypothetical protein